MRVARSVALGFLSLLAMAGSCSSISGAAPVLEVLDTGADGIFGYESLEDQIVDSDAVIVGPIVDVTLGPTERADDGDSTPMQFIHLHVQVVEVLRQTTNVAPISNGDVLLVETLKPRRYSLEQIRRTFEPEHEAVHLLFHGPRLRERMGESTSAAESWLLQSDSSMLVQWADGETVYVSPLPEIDQGASYPEILATIRKATAAVADLPQPEEIFDGNDRAED